MPDEPPFDAVGGGPYSPGMGPRVAKLESGMDELRATLARLEPTLARLAIDTAEIKGSLSGLATAADLSLLLSRVDALPNVWQSVAINGGTVITLLLAFAGLLKILGLLH